MWLGLDVGASKCAWTALSGDGAEPRRGHLAEGFQAALAGSAPAGFAQLIGRVRDQLGADIEPAATVAAVAGAGESGVRSELEAAAPGVRVTGDVEAAAAAVLGAAPGVCLWSGTGSFAVAVDAGGGLHRVGGRGYLLGDRGSGYDLVRSAAQAAVAARDGLGPPTVLGAVLREGFGAPSVERLGAVLQRLDTAEVAARAPLVLAAADDGDPVADDVVDRAVEDLARLVEAACSVAGLDPTAVDVHVGGGVLGEGSPLGERLVAAMAMHGFSGSLLRANVPASDGAAHLARGLAEGGPLGDWIDRGPA